MSEDVGLFQDQLVLGKDYSNLLIVIVAKNTIWFINHPCHGDEALARSKKQRYFGKFDGKADEGFFVGYSLNSKAFRVFNSGTRIVEKICILGTQSNGFAGTKASDNAGQARKETEPVKDLFSSIIEKEDNVNNTNNVNAASTNEVNAVGGKKSIELPFDPNMPALEDVSIFDFS
ncbi:hypothetical protein Tco_1155146 [Tanacetum coccineum]